MAGGSEWIAHGQPDRRTSLQRVDILEISLRLGEVTADEQAIEHTDEITTPTSQEVRPIWHGVLAARPERDYHDLCMFLIPAIWNYPAIEAIVLEVQNGADVYFHTYAACPAANESMIFLVSSNGQMMWGKATPPTTATNSSDWVRKVDNGRAVTHPAANWGHRLEVVDGKCNDLLPFGHCGMRLKAGATKLSVGTWTPPAASERDAGAYSNFSLRGRRAVVARPWMDARRAEDESGVAASASSSPTDF